MLPLMPSDETIVQVFVSTKVGQRVVKLSPHPQGNAQRAAGAPPKRRRRRNLSKPITVTVVWVGGAEGSWVFKDPHRSWRYPGHHALGDCLQHWISLH